MSFPEYSEYEYSGFDWLGMIPRHWRTDKFRYVFTESNEKIENEVVGEMLSVSGYRGIEIKIYDDENKRRTEEELQGYRIVRPGQLVVNTMWLNYAGLGVSNYEGHVSPAYRSYWINADVDLRFIHHLMRSSIYVQGYTQLLTGIRPNSLQMSRDDLMGFPVVLAPRAEQTQIARFLDHETAKIDALIREQERLIELLQEKRQAVISHAVTKGLDPKVPMKDSGVEWLGELPAHWEAARVKHVATFITSGPRGWSDFITEGSGDVFLQSGDLNDNLGLKLDTAKRVKPPLGAEGMRTKLKSGDVVVCITGANTGRVAVVEDLQRTTFINQHLSLIRADASQIDPRYLALSLSSLPGRSYFDVVQYGLKEGLSLTNVSEAPIALPSVEEQELIVKTLNNLIGKFNALSKATSEKIALLQERRSALISAAVTGKIDVRNWQTPTEESAFGEEARKAGMEATA